MARAGAEACQGVVLRGGKGRRGTTLRSCDQSAVKGSWPRTRKSQWMGLPTTSESRSDFYSVSTQYLLLYLHLRPPAPSAALSPAPAMYPPLSLHSRLSANCSAILLLLKPWEYLCLCIVVVVAAAVVVVAFRMKKKQNKRAAQLNLNIK